MYSHSNMVELPYQANGCRRQNRYNRSRTKLQLAWNWLQAMLTAGRNRVGQNRFHANFLTLILGTTRIESDKKPGGFPARERSSDSVGRFHQLFCFASLAAARGMVRRRATKDVGLVEFRCYRPVGSTANSFEFRETGGW